MDEFDALLLPIGLVYAVEDFYPRCALVDELAKVERDVLGDVVAVILAILQVLVYRRHVVRHLLWHTSRKQMSAKTGCLCFALNSKPDIDAAASRYSRVYYACLLLVPATCSPRCTGASTSAADDYVIVLLWCRRHVGSRAGELSREGFES